MTAQLPVLVTQHVSHPPLVQQVVRGRAVVVLVRGQAFNDVFNGELFKFLVGSLLLLLGHGHLVLFDHVNHDLAVNIDLTRAQYTTVMPANMLARHQWLHHNGGAPIENVELLLLINSLILLLDVVRLQIVGEPRVIPNLFNCVPLVRVRVENLLYQIFALI